MKEGMCRRREYKKQRIAQMLNKRKMGDCHSDDANVVIFQVVNCPTSLPSMFRQPCCISMFVVIRSLPSDLQLHTTKELRDIW